MCIFIGLQVCFHSGMKDKNDVGNMVGCLQVVRIYSFMEEIIYIFVLCIISSLSLLKQKIIILYKRNKTYSPFLQSLVKTL